MSIFWRLLTIAYLLGGVHFLNEGLKNSNLSVGIFFFVLAIIMTIVIIGEKIEEAIKKGNKS